MKPFFDSTEKIAALEREAETWIGTPFMANSAAKGINGGVACHRLPTSIYIAVGALPSDFPVVIGSPTGTRHSKISVMEPFLNERPEFECVDFPTEPLRSGDLLGFQIFRCVDHLGVLITGPRFGKFIDVLVHKHVAFNSLGDPTYAARLKRVWRPVYVEKN